MDAHFWQLILRGAFTISWFVGIAAVVAVAFIAKTAIQTWKSSNEVHRENSVILTRLDAFIPIIQNHVQELAEVIEFTRQQRKFLEEITSAALSDLDDTSVSIPNMVNQKEENDDGEKT